jgi:hypothetical protein
MVIPWNLGEVLVKVAFYEDFEVWHGISFFANELILAFPSIFLIGRKD